jgi:hypothetical protein
MHPLLAVPQDLIQCVRQRSKGVLQDEPQNPKKHRRFGKNEPGQNALPERRKSSASPQHRKRKRAEHHNEHQHHRPRALPKFGSSNGRSIAHALGNRRVAAGRCAATATETVAQIECGVAPETNNLGNDRSVHEWKYSSGTQADGGFSRKIRKLYLKTRQKPVRCPLPTHWPIF